MHDFVTFANTARVNSLINSYGRMLETCAAVSVAGLTACPGVYTRSIFNNMADAEANAGRWLAQYGRNAFHMWCEYGASDKAVSPAIEDATGRILRKVCLGRESIFSSPKENRACLIRKYNRLVAICLEKATQIYGMKATMDPQHLAAGILFNQSAGPEELAGWYLSLYKEDARQMWGRHLADKERITGMQSDKADLEVLQLLDGCR